MNYATLTVKGESYKLKATTGAKVEAEQVLGDSLLGALDKFAQSNSVSIVLWAGLQAFNHGMEMRDVYKLMDSMEDEGFELNGQKYETLGVDEKGILIYEVLKVSGFFTKAQIAEMNNELNEAIEEKPKTKTKA